METMRKTLGLTMASVAIFSSPVVADEVDYFSLSLEELADIEITSVSKREEKAAEVAAAVQVITAEDIKRSGATSIPEALRMVPGVNVARAGTGQWAISIRGFNAQFSNKLLVLIDGRSVYTPLFSGVLWDVQDTMLEDVDRIEVIRGPGGTIWGANAMNGVINIITKKAEDTQGEYASYLHGFHDQQANYRHGGKIDEDASYRVFAKQVHKKSFKAQSGGDSGDQHNQYRAGMRVDHKGLSIGELDVQSEVYRGTEDAELFLPSTALPYTRAQEDKYDVMGGHVLANWQHDDESNEYTLKTYYDYTSRDTLAFEATTHTFDVDFNHSFAMMDAHDIIWGLGYRLVVTDIDGTDIISYNPARRNDNLFSAFLQDKISLSDSVSFTVGSKFQHNDYTGFEWQPSARMGWKVSENQFAWASFTRAVRTPGRSGHDLDIAVAATLTPFGPGVMRQMGNEGTNSEKLNAYEIGYRISPVKDVSLDVASFYHDYNVLGGDSLGTPYPSLNATFGPHLVLPIIIDSNSSAETYGIEVSADWQLNDAWKVSGSYSALEVDVDGGSTFVSGEGRSPKHQVNFEAHYTPDRNWEFDTYLYYVDELNPSQTVTIPDYWRLDTRLAYNFDNGMSLSLVGQNLLDDQKPEFSPFVYNQQIEIPRTVYGRISWEF